MKKEDIGENHTDKNGKEWYQLTKKLKNKTDANDVVRQLKDNDHKVEKRDNGFWYVFIPMMIHKQNCGDYT